MLQRTEGRKTAIFCDDLTKVATFLNTPRKWHQQASRTEMAKKSWDLGVGLDGAWQLARDGWTQGATALALAVEAIEPESTLPEKRYDFGGEQVDVARYLGGSMDCMVSRGRNHKQKPVVHLIVNASASASVSADSIAAYGAALTAVIDRLENAGRRVELDLIYKVTTSGGTLMVGWKVKRAEDHCDMSAIAFSIAHPAAWRRIGFALMERTGAMWEDSMYGMPSILTTQDLPFIGAEGAFILPGVGRTADGHAGKVMLDLAISQINEAAGEEIVHGTD